MAVPNIFGTATSAIPLSQLDQNFATAITLGNTAVYLGNTTTSLGNVTLTNVTISSGNVTLTGANVSGTANVSTLVVTGNQTSLGNVVITGNVSANIATFSAGTALLPAITTTGDPNTGIFFPAADTIAFSEGSVEAMRIDSAGNVGVGVTPSIWGTAFPAIQVKNASFGGGTTLADWAAVGANVNLSTNTFATGSKYISDGYASYYRQYLGAHTWYTAPSGLAGNAITFSERMRIDDVGNVGIGTSSPDANLTVNGAASFAAGTALLPSIASAGDLNTGMWFPAADTIAFSEGGAEAMRIDSSGNVGIGTSSPSTFPAKFAVSGSVASGGQNYSAGFSDAVNSTFRIGHQSGLTNLITDAALAFYTASTERMRIDSSGNLLVNSTSNINFGAASKLFVLGNGTGMAVGYGTSTSEYRTFYMNSGDGALYFHNNSNFANLSSAGAWTNASDARLKKNIVDIKYGLADVLRLQPRSYQMNDVAGNFVGFVAQELQTVIPEVVSGDPEKQLGVDYGSLVAVAFKAIQEQQSLITALTARITALESI
jgi:hypothetical protein